MCGSLQLFPYLQEPLVKKKQRLLNISLFSPPDEDSLILGEDFLVGGDEGLNDTDSLLLRYCQEECFGKTLEEWTLRCCEDFLFSSLAGECLLRLDDLLNREDWLEEGGDLLGCVDFLRFGSFIGGDGLLEAAVLLSCEGLLGDSFL